MRNIISQPRASCRHKYDKRAHLGGVLPLAFFMLLVALMIDLGISDGMKQAHGAAGIFRRGRGPTTINHRRPMMAYVDGFVIPVARARLDEYKEMSRQCGAIWRELGALEFRECVGDDVKPGKLTSFPQSVLLEDDEVTVFSWIVYASRARRDEVNRKVMDDPRMAPFMKPENMPFDGKRMIYGGFKMVVDL